MKTDKNNETKKKCPERGKVRDRERQRERERERISTDFKPNW